MGNIVLSMSVSLDGYFEGPDHDIGWHLVDEELHQHFNDWLRPAGALLAGRVTHELMAGFWPHADEDPDVTGPMREFAEIWREKPKIVFSRHLEHPQWNTVVWRDVDAAEIHKLKERTDGDLVLGGAILAASFAALDLIDEYHIYVHPVLIGRGRPVFPATDTHTPLRLAGTHTFGNGVVLLHYARATAEGRSAESPD